MFDWLFSSRATEERKAAKRFTNVFNIDLSDDMAYALNIACNKYELVSNELDEYRKDLMKGK